MNSNVELRIKLKDYDNGNVKDSIPMDGHIANIPECTD